jgi:hypothetical protein
MATGAVTVTTAANMIPELWASDVLRATEANLQLSKKVKRYDTDAKYGDIIHIPNLANLSAAAKTASTDVTFTNNTETKIDLTINQHQYVAFKLEDIVAVQSKYDLMKEYTNKAGYGLAKAIDSSIATLATGFSQTTGSAGTALTDAVIVSSIVYLDEADAPLDKRTFAIRPSSKGDIMKLDKFVLGYAVGTPRQNSWELGQVYGVDVVTSTNVTLTDATVDVENNFMFQEEAIGLAIQKEPKVDSQYMVRSLAWEVAVSAIWGVIETRDTFGVWVKS